MPEIKKLRCAKTTQSLVEISNALKKDLCTELVCEEKVLNDKVILLCFEEYYFRCSSYVSLSVMLAQTEEFQEAVVVGFGGGEGLLNISWGANQSFASEAIKILNKFDFFEVS